MNKEELRKRIEDQVELEKRAHQHVQTMVLTECVGNDIFQTVLNEIMPGHYADIVEERSISRLCGYPLCSNKLTKVPHQKFHISMKTKKIYDITERKLFCSNNCFKSSKHIQSQISTDPLWLREDKVVFEFLEVPLKQSSENKESENQQSFNSVLTQELETVQNHTELTNVENDNEGQICDAECLSNRSTEVNTTNQTKLIDHSVACTKKTCVVNIERLCEMLDEWCTFDTYKFFKSKADTNSSEPCGSSDIKEEAKEKQFKLVKEFLEDNVEYQTEIPGNSRKIIDSKSFVSPPVDSKSQNHIRRNIVSQKLKNSLSDVFSELRASYYDFQFDLPSLLKTFRLTNQNISLKPNEWKIMALVMLYGFAKQDLVLQEVIDKRVKEMEGILSKYGTDKDEFTRLLCILDQYTQKRQTAKEYIDEGIYDNDSLD